MDLARLWLTLGAAYGLLGVLLGAFGAHALSQRLSPEMLRVWHIGVEYQFYHALALLALGVLVIVRPAAGQTVTGICFALGILLFSGSLYALALSGVRGLGVITPIGGVLFVVGWVSLIASLWRGA